MSDVVNASTTGVTSMVGQRIGSISQQQAIIPMILRAAMVGSNFAVMVGLAAWLGLATFGELAVTWGLALVVAPVISLGGPLLLLRVLTDGRGVSYRTLFVHAVIMPMMLGLAFYICAEALWPRMPWRAVVFCAFAINLLTCLSSLMRGLGSVLASMAIRDCGPQAALGVAAIYAQGADILAHAALWMAGLALIAAVWAWGHQRRGDIVGRTGASIGASPALWGTSVLGVALAQVDIIVGGALLSPSQMGLYALLKRVANLVALPVSVATWVSAADISKSFANGDLSALQNASRAGSRIALLPGTILFIGAMLFATVGAKEGGIVFAVLSLGAFIQVVFASGFPVATLCGFAHVAAMSRAVSVLVYVALAAWVIGPLSNAVAYVASITAGSVVLWFLLWQRTRVDTSAFALFLDRRGGWKPS